jgi:molybdopterin-guanine dinucleotide biosynthesis protein B
MGKTTLLERLIPELTGHSAVWSVSLIKHSHKSIDIDRPGKDSYRLREAGCSEVVAGQRALGADA